MIRHRSVLIAASALASTLALTACGASTDSTSSTGAAAQVPASSAAASSTAGSGMASTDMLMAKQTSTLGAIVTDGSGMTLYRYDKDTASPSMSMCTGECAKTWMPVMAESTPQVDGVDAAMVGTVTRDDGMKQLTLAGWPLYRYMDDTQAGDWKGQGSDGVWYAVTPTGTKAAKAAASGSAESTPSMEGMEGMEGMDMG